MQAQGASKRPPTVPNYNSALIAAALVTFFGFGVLNLLYLAWNGPESLPGLYSYRSATIGDGILLPLLAYCLLVIAGPSHNWTSRDHRIAIAAGIIGATLGALTQVAWLLNPDPRLNWTLPSPHHFNLAGWYHAAFLVAFSGLSLAFAALAWTRLHRSKGAAAKQLSLFVALAVFASIGFVGILSLDNGASWVYMVLISCVAATILMLAILAAVGIKHLQWVVQACIAGLLPAIALSAFLSRSLLDVAWTAAIPIFSAACIGAFCASILAAHSVQLVIVAGLAAVTCGGTAAFFSLMPDPQLHMLLWGFLLSTISLSLSLVMLEFMLRTHREPKPSTNLRVKSVIAVLFPAYLVLGMAFLGRYFADFDHDRPSWLAFIPLLIAFFVPAAVEDRVQPIIEAERQNASPSILAHVKQSGYLAVATLYAAVLSTYLTWFPTQNTREQWYSGEQDASRQIILLAIFLVAVVVAMELAMRSTLRSSAAGTTFATIAGLSWFSVMLTLTVVNGFDNVIQMLISIIAALYSAAFIYESILGNIVWLVDLKITNRDRVIAFTCSITVGATCAWMTGPAISHHSGATSVGYALLALLIGVAACVLVPLQCARSLPGSKPERRYVIGSPVGGVVQDTFVIMALVVSISWLPNYLLARLHLTANWLLVVLPYVVLLASTYFYVMQNNVGHVARETTRFADVASAAGRDIDASEERVLNRLGQHIKRQNWIAFLALMPFGLLGFFGSDYREACKKARAVLGFHVETGRVTP